MRKGWDGHAAMARMKDGEMAAMWESFGRVNLLFT
jgi:hypothetical protein